MADQYCGPSLALAALFGNPQQNAYVERYNRTVRHEWLEMHEFAFIEHAQEEATKWLWTYNNERPNIAIGGITYQI